MKLPPDKIRSQLRRLLASPEFVRSERLGRFLTLVVERSLTGDADALRERQIGIDIFDRDPDWDPKLDNIVRSEARRLRQKLEAYAESASPDEEIRISMPRGGYMAEFVDLPGRPSAPTVATASESVAPPVRNPGPALAPRWVYSLAGIAVALLAFLATWTTQRRSAVEAKTEAFEILPFANELGEQFSPSISPDGKQIAYVWDGNASNYDIYIKGVPDGPTRRFTQDPHADLHPAWSPDGRSIAFLRMLQSGVPEIHSASELIIKDVQTGTERKLALISNQGGSTWASENPLSGCQSLGWSPDGKSLLLADSSPVERDSGLVLISTATGERRMLNSAFSEDRDCYPRFSPDGHTVAFVRYISHGIGEVFVIASDGTGLKQLTFDRRSVRGLDWTPDGSRLLFASNLNGLYELRSIPREGGEQRPVPADTAAASEPVFARTGEWLAYVESDYNWNIWRARIRNGRLEAPQRFLSSQGRNHSPSYSPDGTTIAFVSDRSGSPEIWFTDADGTRPRRMTSFGGPWLGTIRWRPDGKAIVFDARPQGHSAIFTMPAAGGQPHLLVQDEFEARRPSWSRDGQSIYFDSTRGGKPQVWQIALDGSTRRELTQTDTLFPVQTPDGKTLIYLDGHSGLWRSNPDGTAPIQLPEAVRPQPDLDWSLTKDGIVFARQKGTIATIALYRFADGTVQPMAEIPQTLAVGTPSLNLSPDGQWVLYSVIEHTRSEIKIRRTTRDGNKVASGYLPSLPR